MEIKICGITQLDQANAIVAAGADYLGFICVPTSPRWLEPAAIQAIVRSMAFHGKQKNLTVDGGFQTRSSDQISSDHKTKTVGVFANATLSEISAVQSLADFDVLQLHGQESPEFCHTVKTTFPQIQVWKALRIKSSVDLQRATEYETIVDRLLLDAYHPQLLGGTGETIDWILLQAFAPSIPWILAGGLTPENVAEALTQLHPQGVDVSSGVERSPGDKDLGLVQAFIQAVQLPFAI